MGVIGVETIGVYICCGSACRAGIICFDDALLSTAIRSGVFLCDNVCVGTVSLGGERAASESLRLRLLGLRVGKVGSAPDGRSLDIIVCMCRGSMGGK